MNNTSTIFRDQFVETRDGQSIYAGDALYVCLRHERIEDECFEVETQRMVAKYSRKAPPIVRTKAIKLMAHAAPIPRAKKLQLAFATAV
jgi:hypothetical protein